MKTHNKLITLALAAFATATVFVAIAMAGGRTDSSAASTLLDPQEAEFMQILNNYRAQNSLGPILIDPSLQAAAEWMSTDMGVNNYFSHTDSTGGSPWDRMCDHGYCYNTWKGENIAAGYGTAQAVFDGWKGSPGHNANMLGQHYVVMGIAFVHTPGSTFGNYWTNDFGGHNPNPNPSPPPAPTNTPSPTTTLTPAATPTHSPTQTATHAPTSTAATPTPKSTPKPTTTATPSPTPEPSEQPPPNVADVDCDGTVTISDVLALLHFLAGVPHGDGTCPPIGQDQGAAASAEGTGGIKGDVDCNGMVDGQDAITLLRAAGSVGPASLGCS